MSGKFSNRFTRDYDQEVALLLEKHLTRGSIKIIQPSLLSELQSLWCFPEGSPLKLVAMKEVENKLKNKRNRVQKKLRKIVTKSPKIVSSFQLKRIFFINN
jgi:hypothetical protein